MGLPFKSVKCLQSGIPGFGQTTLQESRATGGRTARGDTKKQLNGNNFLAVQEQTINIGSTSGVVFMMRRLERDFLLFLGTLIEGASCTSLWQ